MDDLISVIQQFEDELTTRLSIKGGVSDEFGSQFLTVLNQLHSIIREEVFIKKNNSIMKVSLEFGNELFVFPS
jgi:hypothetical protein